MVENVGEWLEGLGFSKYADVFADNEIDQDALPLITADDLKEIGIPVGARRLLLAAIENLAPSDPEASPSAITQPREVLGSPQKSNDVSLRQVTIVFIDVVGSTALSQKLDPETMRDVIRQYQDAVAGVILRFGGHVAKFLGDGVLAYFGWPQAYEDQADRAVHAALDAISAVRGVNFEGGLKLQSRIGVATGEVIVGDLLGETLVDTDAVIGETPNLAARLQGVAGPDELVICATTVKLISDLFKIDKPFKAELKGFDHPVKALRVIGRLSEKSRFDQRRGPKQAQLVGRNHELGLLLDRWEQAANFEGQVVVLSGDAGIGKSRLVQAFLAHPEVEAHSVCHLQCSTLHNNSPLFPVIQYLENLAGIYAADDHHTRIGKIDAIFDQSQDQDAKHSILSLLELPLEPGSNFLGYDPERGKAITFQAVRNLLRNTTEKLSGIIVLEDAHWIDPTTKEFIDQLVVDFSSAPVLMIVTHRPGWNENWSQTLDHVSTLSLGKLSLKQVSNMVIDLLGEPVSVNIIAKISERADGNPLYIEEITKTTRGTVNIDDKSMANIPETLQASLLAQIDKLEQTARGVAQVASVIGREFSHNLVLKVHSLSESKLQPALEEMINGQFIQYSGSNDEAKYTFRHALIQEAIYNSLLRKQRCQLHKNVAKALVDNKREGMRSQDDLIAQHYEQASLGLEAIPYWRSAGRQASQRASMVEAIQFFTNALKLAETLDKSTERLLLMVQIMIQLGKVQNLASRLDDAIKTYLQCVEIAKQIGASKELLEAALGLELTEFYSGRLEYHSAIVLPEVLQVLGDEPTIDRCRVLGYLGRATCSVGNPIEGYEISRKATEQARELGDTQLLVDTLSSSLTLWHLPQNIEQRAKDAEEFTRISKASGAPDVIFRNISLRIAVVAEIGDVDLFDELIDEMDSRIRTHQIPLQHWVHTCSVVMRDILRGNFAKAEQIANTALSQGQAVNTENAEGVYGVQMFTIRREQGRLAEIAPFIKKITDENPDDVIWKPGLALIASELGFMEPAAKIFNQLAENNFRLANDAKLSTTLSYIAEVCARLNDKKRAKILYNLMLPYQYLNVTIGVTVLCIGSVDRYLGLLTTTMEDYDTAEKHFETALKMNTQMRAHPWLAYTQADYARLLDLRHMPDDLVKSAKLIRSAEIIAADLNMIALQQKLQKFRLSKTGKQTE